MATSEHNLVRGGTPVARVTSRRILAIAAVVVSLVGILPFTTVLAGAPQDERALVLDVWATNKPVFGISVPLGPGNNSGTATPAQVIYIRDAAQRIAKSGLYDFALLNLENSWDTQRIAAVNAGFATPMAEGRRKTLFVRIPSISEAGADVTRTRVHEALALGADGVVLPHIRNADEARDAITYFRVPRMTVWTPSNPKGGKIAILMLEDPGAVAQAGAIADVPGYSVLAAGVAGLRLTLMGDADRTEAGVQSVLTESRRTRLVNLIPATAVDVEQRVKEGFLAILATAIPPRDKVPGRSAEEAIQLGRKAAGR